MPLRWRSISFSTALLLLALASCGADLDSSVVSQMRVAVPGANQVQILKRIQASAALDLVVVMASPKGWPPFSAESNAWYPDRILGTFLQRRNEAGTVYKILIETGPGCDSSRIERATATDLVVSCFPEKGDDRAPNRKFLYDIRSKALVGKVEYQPFSLSRLFLSNHHAVLVGTDRKQVVALQDDPSSEPPFRLLTGQAAERWTNRVPSQMGSTGPTSEPYLSLASKPFRTLRFGPENRFALIAKSKSTEFQPASGFFVTERTGQTTKQYRLPRVTFNEFARARPQSVRNGNTRESAKFFEEIGPSQLSDGTLWFAKKFDDGEGYTGVGGFGYFDTNEKKFKIYSPAEVLDWSATAMLVEPEAIWLGLSLNGEYRSTSGGLLRFDRKTEKVVRIQLPDLVYEIARVGDRLVMATDFGVALMDTDGKMRRFFVDKTMRGQLQVSEAIPVGSEKSPANFSR